MATNRSQYSNQNDALNDLIVFFAERVDHLPEVKLDKLVYIAHLYHYANFGELLTKTRFFSLSYGPHAPTIRSALKRLLEKSAISLVKSRTSSDPVYSNPCLIIKTCGSKDNTLYSSHLNTLQKVLEDWGDKPYEAVLDYVARTIPHVSTPYREPIDWTMSRPRPELKAALSYPERVRIHRFVEDPETPLRRPDTSIREASLQIHEVVEIYLAVCGEEPGKAPSPQYLGFDLPSVFHALSKGGAKERGDPEESGDEIEQAAQIADSLMTSLSFRAFSARVALQAGMLLLRKLGYSYAGDVLERHWPDENSYEILKEWFATMSLRVDTSSETC
jgi:hypothetical protein